MCIIFLHVDSQCKKSKFKVILAANRDEFFNRPSLPADFHGNKDLLCGIDDQPGVQGGTWLGVNRFGKFSFLTNILKPKVNPDQEARGTIVKKYLELSTSPKEYIENHLAGVNFRPFNFVGGAVLPNNDLDICFYGTDDIKTEKLKDGFHVVTCTSLHKKWNKSEHGLDLFSKTVSEVTEMSDEVLIESLLDNVLSDTICLYPDEEINNQSKGKFSDDFLKLYCSVNVESQRYGTVAHTVILIDENNHVYFVEKSRQSDNVWTTKKHRFDMHLN